MKYVVPVHRVDDCGHLDDESKIAVSCDEYGVRFLYCVEDGPFDAFDKLEFDSLEELKAYLGEDS